MEKPLKERNPTNRLKKIWFKLKGETIPEEPDPKIYPAKNLVGITTEPDIHLYPCTVSDDHKIAFKFDGKKQSRKIMVKESTLTIPLKQIWPHRIFKYWAPRRQRFRVFFTQAEGEFTHNPNTTGVTEEGKKRFETALKLEGEMIEAHLTREAVKDMKDTKAQWFDYIPYICMAVMGIAIVFIMNGGA